MRYPLTTPAVNIQTAETTLVALVRSSSTIFDDRPRLSRIIKDVLVNK